MRRFLTDSQLKEVERDHPELSESCCITCRGSLKYKFQGEEHDCNCQEQRTRNLAYSYAGIGLTYQRMSWDDLVTAVPDLLTEYLELSDRFIERGIGLFLHGPNGTGKSLVASLLLKDLVNQGVDCYATTYAQVSEQLSDGWRDPADKRRFERRFMLSKVLLLDDLGRNLYNSKLAPTTLDYVLRTRVQESRPTILTSNLDNEQTIARYDSAVVSMLVEQCLTIKLGGADHRPMAHAKAVQEVRDGIVRPIQ